MSSQPIPYSEFRNVGLPWLPRIAAHWDIRRNGRLFAQRREVGFPHLPILEVSLRTGVSVRNLDNLARKQMMSNVAAYQRAAKDDITYNMMRLWQGAVGVAPVDGLVSPAYVVARPYPEVSPRYYAYLFRTDAYMNEVDAYSRGIVKDRNRLYWEDFKQIASPFPPFPEQQAIARFLDHHATLVARVIRTKRRLIALLTEQKQAITQQAVTRGLDPDAPMKPSGLPWLGEMPAHWEKSRIKREFRCLDHRRVPLSSTERGMMTARQFDYYGASGVIDKVDDYLFDDELVLLAEDGANLVLRNLPLAIIAQGKFWANNHAHVLKPTRGDIGYLASVLEVIDYRPWITGAAQPKLTGERLLSISIPAPPPDEQRQIMDRLHEETRTLRLTIERTQREINLIREYRTRLIADIVTGQLDVREAAAALPDTEPDDASGALTEVDAFDPDLDPADAEVIPDEDLDAAD